MNEKKKTEKKFDFSRTEINQQCRKTVRMKNMESSCFGYTEREIFQRSHRSSARVYHVALL